MKNIDTRNVIASKVNKCTIPTIATMIPEMNGPMICASCAEIVMIEFAEFNFSLDTMIGIRESRAG